jgi:hypothetical protein
MTSPDPPRNPLHYTLRVTLEEDLHTGTGLGRGGDLDAAQAVDRHGRPTIRATHLKGVLLQAAQERRALLSSPSTDRSLESLFGEEGNSPGALLMESLRCKKAPANANVIWASTAREPGSRAPAHDTLRTTECIPANTELECRIELREPKLKDLFEKTVCRTDRLGAERQRGFGHIRSELEPLEKLEPIDGIRKREKGATRLRLVLRSLDPLCLARTGNPTNLIPTEAFIRGQALRGALARWLHNRDVRGDLLLDRSLEVSDALPLPADWDRNSDISQTEVLPIPLHVGVDPGDKPAAPPDVPWWVRSSLDPFVGATLCERGEVDRLKRPPGKIERPSACDFLYRPDPGTPWRRYQPLLAVHLRAQIPDVRTAGAKTQLFSQEEIAEETFFLADLTLAGSASEDAAKKLDDLLEPLFKRPSWLAVGRGGRPAEIVAARWLTPTRGRVGEASGSAGAQSGGGNGKLRITLESDLIARSENLAFFDALDERVLASLLGLDGSALKDCECEGVSEPTEVYGFNAATGMPRAVAIAIRRGSVLEISGSGADELRKKLAARGGSPLGERTWDGFGRYRIDFDPFAKDPQDAGTPAGRQAQAVGAQAASGRQAAAEAPVNAREELLGEALALANKIKKGEGPSRSQWMGLRDEAQGQETRQNLSNLLERLKSSDRLSAKAWQAVPIKEIKTWCDDHDPDPGKALIDAIARWAAALEERKR